MIGPGSVIAGDLVVRELLAEGGMGSVFVAEQKSTGKLRAVKVMRKDLVADAILEKRFAIEARVGAKIASEHVVDVLSAGIDDATGLPYLVMELLEGEDLGQKTKRSGALPPADVRDIFEQLCHAMAAAHDAGVVHRDLKPENVFLAETQRAGAPSFTVKVLDFGIARLAAETGAGTTRATKGAVGSPLWMAPEQTAPGPITPAADVWALGLLAYELLTGKSYWKTANVENGTAPMLLREIVLDPLPRASERAESQGTAALLPRGFDGWFARCVDRDPAARLQDARAAWHALDDVFAGRGPTDLGTTVASSANVSPKAKSVNAPAPAKPSRIPMLIGVGVVIVVGGAGLGVMAGRGGGAEGPSSASASTRVPLPEPEREPEPVPASASARASASASAPARASASASASARASASASASAPASTSASTPPSAPAVGFADPVDRGAPLVATVSDRKVRVLFRLVSNASPASDAAIREGIERDSWRFSRCYSSAFGSMKDLPEGTVTISYDIEDSLPRHAKLVSSTFANPTIESCLVSTVTGQMLNGIPSAVRGRAVHAFRFVP